jgi:selenocysteine-specific elongation factor
MAGEGIELERVADDIKKKDIRDLVKLGFLISLDGNIIYHKQVYDDMTNKVLALFSTRDKITVPEAKDAVGLSRKFILPLLNRIENDGLIRRLGDFRVKV